MSKYKLYSFKDCKVGFEQPMLFVNDGQALRAINDFMADEKSVLNKHAEDYQFYCIGTFDLDTGEITPDVKFMANVVDYKTDK